ncbi:hypothetical protein [Streptomyces beijiangensis]|uniref:Uncharacterized protein n=1 Tax=Streptomyces beijiangensis TaxID=163361 RepID=A0A939F3R2_9ACTN|nr:hypothetical protein [Streptomyces beijiangensis]MBO0511348.1 hypothetical protein [Streptomyces beijiangensis]
MDCNTWTNGAGTIGYAHCSGLGHIGAFRVKVTCISYTGVRHFEVGPWVANNKTSSHKCAGADAGQAGVLTVGSEMED